MSTQEKKRTRIYSKAEIKKASSVDIVSYIQAHGSGELEGHGRYLKYHVNGHDSLIVDQKKNYFFHNSIGRGDNILSLLTQYEGYSFQNAVGFLLGEELEAHKGYDESEENKGPYQHAYEAADSTEKVRHYLENIRGIDREIITYLIDNDYLIQDKKYGSAVLNWKQYGLAQEKIVGATSIVTRAKITDSPRKYIGENSEKHYGFNITLGEPKAIYFFEAGIDLLSYWSLHKDLTDCRLVCLEGRKEKTVVKMIQEGYQIFETLPKNGIFYGVDNDPAGQSFYSKCDKKINIKQEVGTDTLIINQALNPYDHQVQQEIIDQVNQAATIHGVDPNLLLTIQKIENNLTDTNKISNDWKAYGYFAKTPKSHAKEETIDLTYALDTLCKDINEKHVTLESIADLYLENKPSGLEQQLLQSRANELYSMYANDQMDIVHEVSKDWNDFLKEQRSEGLITEHTPLIIQEPVDQVNRRSINQFKYYLTDKKDNVEMKALLVDQYNINPKIVDALYKKGLMRQDIHDRIVFLWNDQGRVTGGQLRGTFQSKEFGKLGYEQKIMDFSAEGYGFNVSLGTPQSIHFFQSPEDLLAYWTLNIDQVKDTILFALSDGQAEHVVDNINNKLQAGHKIQQVTFCVGNNKQALELLDKVAQLKTFNQQTLSLQTELGSDIAFQSERPKIGINWINELIAKKDRDREVNAVKQKQQRTAAPQKVEQHYARS